MSKRSKTPRRSKRVAKKEKNKNTIYERFWILCLVYPRKWPMA